MENISFERWLKTFRKKNGDPLSPRTIKQYLGIIKKFPQIENLTDEQANEFVRRRNYPMVAYAVKSFLYYKGLGNMAKSLRIPPRKMREDWFSVIRRKALTEQEIKLLLDNIKDKTLLLMIRILVETACRAGRDGELEFFNIRLRDVDFENNKIKILGKEGNTRFVKFSDKTKEMLESYVKEHQIEDRLFNFSYDKGLKEIKLAGINILKKNITFHTFRHTSLKLMADNHASAFEIKAYAGHKSVVSSDAYIEASSQQMESAFRHLPKF